MAYPTFVSYYEALEILQTLPLNSLGIQKVHFKEALHRICAQEVHAPFDVPAKPTAAMDGYAISFEESVLLQTSGLRLLEVNKAGNPIRPTLQKGCAIKTFTGSLLPLESDTLVIIEHIEQRGDRIFFNAQGKTLYQDSKIHRGQWIRQVGDNYKQGEILLSQGDRIGAFEIGLLAELNHSFVEVYQKARVGILCVGDEIVEVGEEAQSENFVRSVNAHLLESLLKEMGEEAILYPIVRDDRMQLREVYERALNECDFLLTAGGMSVGDYDFTKEIMGELTEIYFRGVRLKPGKPVACGVYRHGSKQCVVLGLPGYPNSCAVTFLLFGAPILARLQGRSSEKFLLQANLRESLKRSDTRMEFRACEVYNEHGNLSVSFDKKRSLQSSMINNLTHNTALALLPENGGDIQAGEKVEILLLSQLVRA